MRAELVAWLGFMALAAAGVQALSPIPVATCAWYAYTKNNPYAGYCYVNPDFHIAVSQEPATYIGKMLTRVYGRNFLCGQQTTGSGCTSKTASLGCSWDSVGKACKAREFFDWRWFTTHTYFEEAPKWLFCPGSPVRQAYACSMLTPNVSLCKANPACGYDAKSSTCLLKSQVAATDKQREQFWDKARAYDPSVVGSCRGSCYLKRVTSCWSPPVARNSVEKWCKAQNNCAWDSGSCVTNLYGTDDWAKAIRQAGSICAKFSNNTACATGGVGAIARSERINKYLNFPSPGDLAPAACT